MNNLMIDLETMGKGNMAAIVEIGACYFDPTNGKIGKTFSRKISLESSIDVGLEMDASTVAWWLRQSSDARTLFTEEGEILPTALYDFQNFVPIDSIDTVQVWGNGATFDNVILKSAFDICGMPTPWKHWNNRDVRTMVEIGRSILGIDPKHKLPFKGVKHKALDDAIHQAGYVSTIWQSLYKQCNNG